MRRRGSSKIGNADRINSDHTRKMKKKEKFKKRFVKYEELPEYMKDNEFIRGYYRCEWPLKDVFFSLFSLHNETLNIWTHLIGFLMFMGMTVMSFMEKTKLEGLIASWFRPGVQEPLMTMMSMMMMNNNSTNGLDTFLSDSYLKYIPKPSVLHMTSDYDAIPKWPWFVFLGGAMGCLICSSVSHLFACHSRSFNLFFWRLDYAGISMMIVCSFFAPIYYAFSCHPYSRFIYLTSISVLGILVIITLLAPVFSTAHFRSFRASLFLAMGFSGMIPAAHAVTLNWDHPLTLVSLGYEIAMGLFYAIGAAFYMSRIPERWKPGAFDIAGHSHQIFHVFVIAGALAHTAATLILMDLRRVSPTCNDSGSQGALGWTL